MPPSRGKQDPKNPATAWAALDLHYSQPGCASSCTPPASLPDSRMRGNLGDSTQPHGPRSFLPCARPYGCCPQPGPQELEAASALGSNSHQLPQAESAVSQHLLPVRV